MISRGTVSEKTCPACSVRVPAAIGLHHRADLHHRCMHSYLSCTHTASRAAGGGLLVAVTLEPLGTCMAQVAAGMGMHKAGVLQALHRRQ